MQNLANDLSSVSAGTRAFLDQDHKLLINGEWCRPAGGEHLPVVDPSSAQVVSQIARGGAEDVDRAVRAAATALNGSWSEVPPQGRQKMIWRLADLLEANIDEFCELEAIDNGKSAQFARMVDIGGGIDVLRYMAGWATKIHGRTFDMAMPFPGAKASAYTVREPVGVVGAITPWNFPLGIGIWKIAPALAAGCTLVIKLAELTSLTTLRFGALVKEAGIPDGVVNIVTGRGREVGEALLGHPLVDKIAFTGSTSVGKHIQKKAAETIKRVTLELGGKSPMIVLNDADPKSVAQGVANLGIYFNTGQCCAAGARLYVHDRIYDAVVEEVSAIARGMKIGPGLSPDSQIWPLVSKQQLETVAAYIKPGLDEGAEAVAGGKTIDADGFYIEPTVLANVRQNMTVVQEEIFGPVLPVMRYGDLEEVISFGNDTPYGLAASIWGRDMSAIQRLIRAIKAGTVWVNTHNTINPAMPFGGFKQSGIGREMGEEVLASYTETKSVCIAY